MVCKSSLLIVWNVGKNNMGQSVYPFQDAGNPIEQRVEDIIRRMTLEEKIDLLSGYKNFNLHPCERLGIPAFHMADGPLGIASWGGIWQGYCFSRNVVTGCIVESGLG